MSKNSSSSISSSLFGLKYSSWLNLLRRILTFYKNLVPNASIILPFFKVLNLFYKLQIHINNSSISFSVIDFESAIRGASFFIEGNWLIFYILLICFYRVLKSKGVWTFNFGLIAVLVLSIGFSIFIVASPNYFIVV